MRATIGWAQRRNRARIRECVWLALVSAVAACGEPELADDGGLDPSVLSSDGKADGVANTLQNFGTFTLGKDGKPIAIALTPAPSQDEPYKDFFSCQLQPFVDTTCRVGQMILDPRGTSQFRVQIDCKGGPLHFFIQSNKSGTSTTLGQVTNGSLTHNLSADPDETFRLLVRPSINSWAAASCSVYIQDAAIELCQPGSPCTSTTATACGGATLCSGITQACVADPQTCTGDTQNCSGVCLDYCGPEWHACTGSQTWSHFYCQCRDQLDCHDTLCPFNYYCNSLGGCSYNNPDVGECFSGGTHIATPSGERNIEDIQTGDFVYSYDPARGGVALGRVVKTFVHPDSETGTVKTQGGAVLRTTANHPFFKLGADYGEGADRLMSTPFELDITRADMLSQSDTLLTLDRGGVFPQAVASAFLSIGSQETVYNFTVEPYHTYFAEGVLVHNK